MSEDRSELEHIDVTSSGEDGDGHLKARTILEKPALSLLRLNIEQTIYLLLLLIAAATRFWALGARSVSHDESLHALFSWKLYMGEGYEHDPMMHGPFLFHTNALIYFLFGVSDFTARIMPAIFGVVLVGLPYFFRRWMGRAGALVASCLFLISPSFLYYSRYIRNDIYIAVWSMLLALALFSYVHDRQQKWLTVAAAVLSLSIATKEVAFITAFIGVTFVVLTIVWERAGARSRAILQIVLGAVPVLLWLVLIALHLTSRPGPTGQPTLAVRMTTNVNFVAMLFVSALCVTLALPTGRLSFLEAMRLLSWERLRVPVLVFAIIYVVLFTTFFTNPKGIVTGSVGAVAYWLAQQPVQRGGQPWYYYFFLMPFYDLIPFFVGIPVFFYMLYRGVRRRLAGVQTDGYWLAFLIYWSVSALVIYSWAGEKMPWLVVHMVQPLLLLSAQLIGDWIEKQEWRAWLRGGGVLLSGLVILMLMTIVVMVRVHPFAGLSLSKLQATGQWLGSLMVLVVLAWLARRYLRRLGRRGILNTLGATALAILTILTVRFAWLANYVNYDYVNEFLVYAHGTPDAKVMLRQLEEISRRVAVDRQLRFSYDQESTWPLEWYFKDYPNRVFYGNEPTKAAMDTPVVIVHTKNEAKARPFLGDRYYQFSYRLVWWPIEEYRGLTLRKIWQVLNDGEALDKWLTIWFYRRHPLPYEEWPAGFRSRYNMYIRKDILNQMWDMGVTLAIPSEMPPDPYQEVWQERVPALMVGVEGSETGQFNSPRGVAVASDGNIYVVDSGNSRVQVFNPHGEFVRAWGSAGSAPGQFTEPWGIAVAENGDVYVADTWNHRIQRFDALGGFKAMWGYFVDVQGEAEAHTGGFWGPRDLAFGRDGNLYITDTGNKRIQVFTPEGQPVGVFGSEGDGPGQFREPVGIAIDSEGTIYVADTWNQRIQVFGPDFEYLREWKVDAWQGESLVNKPYLATDGQRVFASDPEGYRILVFDKDGHPVLTFGRYGSDASGMDLPTGVAVDTSGRLWVTDTQNHRLLRFDNPLP